MNPTPRPSQSSRPAAGTSHHTHESPPGTSHAADQHNQDWFEELKADMLPMIKFTIGMMKAALKDVFQHKLSQTQQAKITTLLDKLPETACAFLKDFFEEDQAASGTMTPSASGSATATTDHTTTTKRRSPARQAPSKPRAKDAAKPTRAKKATKPKSPPRSKAKSKSQTKTVTSRAKSQTRQAKTAGSTTRTQARRQSS